jgi:hypothetical protein
MPKIELRVKNGGTFSGDENKYLLSTHWDLVESKPVLNDFENLTPTLVIADNEVYPDLLNLRRYTGVGDIPYENYSITAEDLASELHEIMAAEGFTAATELADTDLFSFRQASGETYVDRKITVDNLKAADLKYGITRLSTATAPNLIADTDKVITETVARDVLVQADQADTKVWRGTQTQYDGLGSYDANTLYFIDGDFTAVELSTATTPSEMADTDKVISETVARDVLVQAEQQGTKLWRGSQSAYDALGSYDSNTVYMVTGTVSDIAPSVSYVTSCPTSNNTDGGIRKYIGTTDCATKYAGWDYMIIEE